MSLALVPPAWTQLVPTCPIASAPAVCEAVRYFFQQMEIVCPLLELVVVARQVQDASMYPDLLRRDTQKVAGTRVEIHRRCSKIQPDTGKS